MGFPGTVQELKKIIKNEHSLTEEFLRQLASDNRISVKKIYDQLLVQKENRLQEQIRLEKMFSWEKRFGSPKTIVAGVDEAGRGPLAGPITAAAVVLDPNLPLYGLNDSKRLSSTKRKDLEQMIKEKATAWAIGWATEREIDCYNVHNAGFLAMKRALKKLSSQPEVVLVDGFRIPDLNLSQTTLKKGDMLSASIAAASILAKVARDEYMIEMHKKYPAYGFAQNKGYPTQAHYDALKLNGSSPVHRRTFKGVCS